MKISICVFIKDNNRCGFCLWESMATLMPIADEFIVWDYGSTDGTWETLVKLSEQQPKLSITQLDGFPVNPHTGLVDAGSFAVIPNQMIPTAKNDVVLYYQADEIWHDDLMKLLIDRLKGDLSRGLSFWRYHLTDNFQKIKQLPQIVHRLGYKDSFHFVGDGMNSDSYLDAELVSHYGADWFTRWGDGYSRGRVVAVDENGNDHIYGTYERTIKEGRPAWDMPTNEMILDVGSTGAFLENIKEKNEHHAPYWRVSDQMININGKMVNLRQWYDEQKLNEDWTKTESPFDIPSIIRPLVGQTKYPVREDILKKICDS